MEPLNLFMTTWLQSGERKTAVQADATRPVVRWEREKAKDLRPAIIEANAKKQVLEKRIASLEARADAAEASDREGLTNDLVAAQKEQAALHVPVPRASS